MDKTKLSRFLQWLFMTEPAVPLPPVHGPLHGPAPRTVTKNDIRADAHSRALKAYQAGRDFRHLIAGHHLYEIKQWLEMGVATKASRVRIITQTADRAQEPACAACARLHDRVLTIAQVLDTLPLPVLGCTHKIRKTKDPEGWCRCNFRLVEEG